MVLLSQQVQVLVQDQRLLHFRQLLVVGNIIIIDGYNFGAQHPHYLELQHEYGKDSIENTKRFSGKLVDSFVERLSDMSYHLLIKVKLRTVYEPIN